jgi:hypothetical protein
MTEIFDISKIRQNDPLRDEKIKALKGIEKTFEDYVRKGVSSLYLRDEIMKNCLPEIVRNYRQRVASSRPEN